MLVNKTNIGRKHLIFNTKILLSLAYSIINLRVSGKQQQQYSTMTLEELIHQYQIEEYKIFKHSDKDGNKISTHFIFDNHADYLDKYLGFYKELPNLTEVIVQATDGVFKLTNQGIIYFIRHNHQEVFIDNNGNQRGIPYQVSKEVRTNLIIRFNDVLKCRTFDELHNIVQECKVKGFGELAIYDTAMRIASFMNIEPDRVYLHAGAREGLSILESKGYFKEGSANKKYLEITEMPLPMQRLKAAEVEHFLCAKKDKMKYLTNVKGNLPN